MGKSRAMVVAPRGHLLTGRELAGVTGKSPRTTEAYRGAMAQYTSWATTKGAELGAASFAAYITGLKKSGAKSSRVNGALYAGKAAFVRAAQRAGASSAEQAILKTALDSIRAMKTAPPDVRVVTPEERERLFLAMPLRVRTIARFLYFTAARVSEALHIKLADCRRDGAHVRVTLLGKGAKQRTVRIPFVLYEEATAEFEGRTYLFETQNGTPYTRQYITREVARASKRVLGRAVTSHQLRHSRATDLVASTKKLKGVSELLGHADVSTTARFYVREKLTDAELALA